MIRLVWPLMLLAVAAGTTFSQIDRQARYTPALGDWVPAPFASFSLRHSLQRNLSDGNAGQAQLEARALVARRPIPAEHQRWMAQAMMANGNRIASAVTIQRASQHGWRDPAVQESMLILAMREQDHEQAALHLAALWALSGDRELLTQLSPPVLQQPEARERFAEILAGSRWRRNFLTNGPTVLPADLFVETLKDSLRAGAAFDCERLDNSLQRMAAKIKERHDLASGFSC